MSFHEADKPRIIQQGHKNLRLYAQIKVRHTRN